MVTSAPPLPSSPLSSYPRRRAALPFFPPPHTATVAHLHRPRTTMTTTTTMTPRPPHYHPADGNVITIRYHTPVTSWPKGRRADTLRRRHHRFVGLAGKSSVEDRGCVVGKGRADRTMNPSRTSVGTRRTGPFFSAHCPTGRQNPGPYQLCHTCRPPLHPEVTSFHPVWESIVWYMPKNIFWKYPILKLA
jgi:hypothetical protein